MLILLKNPLKIELNGVSRTLKERKALRLYSEFVGNVMKGKSLLLDDKVFPKYTSLWPKYFTSKRKSQLFQRRFLRFRNITN